jgi:transcriptional regulator with XRE-family HTH domain
MPQDADEVGRRIGRKIAQLRHAAGLTQEALAERLGVGVERVSRIERRGNVTVRTIVAVANTLGVDSAELWKEPDPEPEGARRRRGRPRLAR